MISDLSIGDVAIKIAEYRDFKITHDDLVEWAREAMFATKIPPHQVQEVMDLLLEIKQGWVGMPNDVKLGKASAEAS